jgi:hypothetical protein
VNGSVIALAIGTGLVSCGGGNGNKQSGSATATKTGTQAATSGTTLKELNDNNWPSVVKANFGLDLQIPAGWSFQSVKSLNRVNDLEPENGRRFAGFCPEHYGRYPVGQSFDMYSRSAWRRQNDPAFAVHETESAEKFVGAVCKPG